MYALIITVAEPTVDFGEPTATTKRVVTYQQYDNFTAVHDPISKTVRTFMNGEPKNYIERVVEIEWVSDYQAPETPGAQA